MNNNQFDSNNWNWFHYLKAPQDIKDKHYNKAYDLAASWVTCACGELCKNLPKVKDFNNKFDGPGLEAPADNDLQCLGLEFMSNIHNEDYDDAFETLLEIEKRTIKLLDDERNNSKQ